MGEECEMRVGRAEISKAFGSAFRFLRNLEPVVRDLQHLTNNPDDVILSSQRSLSFISRAQASDLVHHLSTTECHPDLIVIQRR